MRSKTCSLLIPRYLPSSLSSPQSRVTVANPTVLVVGGLYGNLDALDAATRRAQRDGAALVFNGDFNFFNTSVEAWNEVNERVLDLGANRIVTGNVEISAVSEIDEYAGCGCDYPSYAGENVPRWADSIVERLHRTAHLASSSLRPSLASLPSHLTLEMPNGARVGLLHGDFHSVSGWQLALERLEPLDRRVRTLLEVDKDHHVTTRPRLETWFEEAQVDVVCCTHTCVAYAQRVRSATGRHGRGGAIFNNGAAGMPNFGDVLCGLATRISCVEKKGEEQQAPPDSLWGGMVNGLRVDAVPLTYDAEGYYRNRFLPDHPVGSPAQLSYGKRLQRGLPWWETNHALARWNSV